MGKGSFINKQWFRYRAAYNFINPLIMTVRDAMWILTSIVLLGWSTLSMDIGVALLAIMLGSLWVIGFIGDKTKFWQDWGSRNIKMTNVEVQEHLFQWQGSVIALDFLEGMKQVYPQIDTSFVEAKIEAEKKWFEAEKKAEGDKENEDK